MFIIYFLPNCLPIFLSLGYFWYPPFVIIPHLSIIILAIGRRVYWRRKKEKEKEKDFVVSLYYNSYWPSNYEKQKRAEER